MEGSMGSIWLQAEININKKINGKTKKTSECVWHWSEGLTRKYVKGDVSTHDSLNKKVSQRGLGSQIPWYRSRVKYKYVWQPDWDSILVPSEYNPESCTLNAAIYFVVCVTSVETYSITLFKIVFFFSRVCLAGLVEYVSIQNVDS
jgi:hypothetical protein